MDISVRRVKFMKPLNHRERLERVLSGEKPDRIPFSFWRHFPVDDQHSERLARSIIEFQQMYDFDFVKVTPSSSFCLYDYGVRDEWCGNPEGTRDYQKPLIKEPKKWKRIKILDPKSGRLADQLHCLALIRKNLPASTPIIQTIFSPIAQLKNIVGRDNLTNFIRQYPQESLQIIEKITDTTKLFVLECKKEKIDGIFYALQAASYDYLNDDEYARFGKPFDLEILFNTNDFWLNVLHIHGNNIMFDQVKDYPCQVLNWHDRETRPSLSKALKTTNKVVCGGLKRIDTMVLGDHTEIKKEIRDAYDQCGGIRLILSTGCVLLLTTPPGNIHLVKELIQSL